MRFNELTSEGIEPSAKAAIKGMRQLSGDQYYGLYKTMKDVAGHDGKKQTAPNGNSDHEVSDQPFAYAYTDEEKDMIKGVDPKAKQITSDKSEELDEGSIVELYQIDEATLNEIDPGLITNLVAVFPTVAKIIVSNALTKANTEKQETAQMIDVLKKKASGEPVTPEESEAMKSQFKDLIGYGLGAVGAALTGGALAGIAGVYKKEILELLKTKGPDVLLNLLKTKNIDIVKMLSAKFLGKNALPFYSAPNAVAEAGFPGAPDVEMPPMKPSGDPQRDKLKQEYMDIHHEIKSLVDIPYSSDSSPEQKMQAKARIKQLNDRADQIKAILEPRQPPNEWQKKTYGYDDNWNIVKKGVAEAGIPFRGTAGAFNRGDDERHDLDAPRPTIYGLKINGKIWQKDGNVVTFFTKERALAARNSILAKRPELEVGLVQRPQD